MSKTIIIRNTIFYGEPATDKQIGYLHALCQEKRVLFPYSSHAEAQRKISKQHAGMAIKSLLSGGEVKFQMKGE